MKNVIKEIFIMLLLCIAIALILAVVFYDYNPINKEVPQTITYQFPNELSDVKEDLDTPLTNNEDQVIRTYEVTEDDLNRAKKTNYDAGKANPFMAYSDNTTTDGNTTNSTGNTTNNNKTNTNSTSKNNTTNSNSQENYNPNNKFLK
mgnify:FL=1